MVVETKRSHTPSRPVFPSRRSYDIVTLGKRDKMSTAADAPSQNGLTVAPDCEPPHILIIGAGITGLVLAQALKKHGIAFTIFERDAHVAARGRGWGLTIHWSLDTFLSLLPQHIVDKLPQVYVDPEASKRGENGNFLFFDLRSGETRWQVPPTKRIRVSRERLRALMLEGLDVQVRDAVASASSRPFRIAC